MQDEDKNRMIGENIKLYRLKAGMTKKDLCEQIYRHQNAVLKPATLKSYELGRNAVSATNLHRIALALHVDIDAFHTPPQPEIVMDDNLFRLVEAYKTTKKQGHKDALLYIAKSLAKA